MSMMTGRFKSVAAAFGVCAAMLMAAMPASATVTAQLIGNEAGTSFRISEGPEGTVFTDPRIDFSAGLDDFGTGVTIDSLQRISPAEIFFKNGVIGMGTYVYARTGVAVTFTNTYDFAYRPVLQSTLVAAGIGAAIVNVAPRGRDGSSCATDSLRNCGPLDQPTLDGFVEEANFRESPLNFGPAFAGFEFDVSVGAESIYSLNGSMTLFGSGAIDDENLGRASSVLTNFQRVLDNPYGRSYAWDDTVVDIALPDLLQPGDSVTAIYTVTTSVDAGFVPLEYGDDDAFTSVAFASFGDPTGGKKPIRPSARSASDFAALADDETQTALPYITTNGFTIFTPVEEIVDRDRGIVTGRLLATTTDAGPVAGVPEPATWAMLLFGFGLVGAALRRGRMKATAVA